MTESYVVDDDILIDKNFYNIKDEGRDLASARGVKPTKDMDFKESEKNMISVFRESTADPFGMEYVYDHINETTRINFMTEEDNSTVYEDLADNNPINYAGSVDPLINVREDYGDDEDVYVGASEVVLDNDYWHEIKLYNEYNNEQLRRLMKDITENGRSDVSVSLQYTVEPLERGEWNKRYPLIYILSKLLFVTPLMTILYGVFLTMSLTLLLFSLLLRLSLMIIRGASDTMGGYYSKIFEAFFKATGWGGFLNPVTLMVELVLQYTEAIMVATGYHRSDFINEYEDEIDRLNGDAPERTMIYNFGKSIEQSFMGYSDPTDTIISGNYGEEEYESAINEIIDEIKRKGGIKENVDNQGYATTFRFVAVGDDKEKVDEKLEKIKKDIESTYNPTSDKNQAGLVVEIADSKEKLKDIIIDMGERSTAKDENNNIVNNYSLKTSHVNREEPMILTAKEIVSFMHLPSDIMSDETLVEGDESVGEGVTQEGVFDEEDIK